MYVAESKTEVYLFRYIRMLHTHTLTEGKGREEEGGRREECVWLVVNDTI